MWFGTRYEIKLDSDEVVARLRSTMCLRGDEFGSMTCLDANKTAKMATKYVRHVVVRLIFFGWIVEKGSWRGWDISNGRLNRHALEVKELMECLANHPVPVYLKSIHFQPSYQTFFFLNKYNYYLKLRSLRERKKSQHCGRFHKLRSDSGSESGSGLVTGSYLRSILLWSGALPFHALQLGKVLACSAVDSLGKTQ